MNAKQYRVENYMNTKVAVITQDATLKEATEKMLQAKTNGLVVVENGNVVVGILSSWDIIQHIVPNYLEEEKHLAAFEAASVFERRIHEVAADPVRLFMTKNVHTTKPEHSIMEAAALLSEFRIRQLPVVDEHNVLLGYINRTDIKRAVGNVLGLSEG